MSLSLTCLPEGLLLLSGEPSPGDPLELVQAFSHSPAHALLHLAARPSHETPPDPALAWLHRFSHHWMAEVCRARHAAPPFPAADSTGHSLLTSCAQEAPPFPGSDYCTAEVLATLWADAGTALAAACAAGEGHTAR